MKKIFRRSYGLPLRFRVRNWLILKLAGKSTIVINAGVTVNPGGKSALLDIGQAGGALIAHNRFDLRLSGGLVKYGEFR